MNKAQWSSVAEDWLVGKDNFSLFHSSKGDFFYEVLLDPFKVFILHVWEYAFEVVLMFLGELKVFDELLDGFESGENCILTSKGVLPEEDFEGGLLFVLVLDEVRVRTGELVEVVVEKVD